MIYVESLESGFGDPALMGEDLLAPLNAATQDAYRFNHYEQTTGTGWTFAEIVSTQCGIPLKSHTLFDNNLQGEKVKSLLPGARCLGELLAGNGYKNVFLGGASLYFAGKGNSLRSMATASSTARKNGREPGTRYLMIGGFTTTRSFRNPRPR